MTDINEILPLLERGTASRRISWDENAEHGVAVLIGNNTIVMDWYQDGSESYVHYIEIRNAEGQVVERISGQNKDEPAKYVRLSGLHALAYRQAKRVDEITIEVIEDLKKIVGR